MDELIVKEGHISIPEQFILGENKKRLHIKTPYSNEVSTLGKDNFMVSSRFYFREKGKDKPYVPEGFIEIDGIMFKVKEEGD